MPTKFSGMKMVSYAPTGSSSYVNIGVPNADADIKIENKSVETSKGTNLYAGKTTTATIPFSDTTAYSVLETGMKANTEYDIKVTYMDDTTEVIAQATTVMVTKDIKGKVGELNGFKLSFTVFQI